MRKSHIISAIFIALLASLTSCEKIIEFGGENDSGITVFVLATTDRPLSLLISRSLTVNNNPSMIFSRYERYYHEIDSIFHESASIKNAEAEITVNGTHTYTLTYTGKTPYNYTCNYTPRVGDDIEVHIKAQGFKEAKASTHIYEPRKIEVVRKKTVHKKIEYDPSEYYENPYDRYGLDSVMQITLRIHDPARTHDFYRLKVRGVAEREDVNGVVVLKYYNVTDVFSSEDVIFIDNMLTKPYGDWKAGISDVFDDHMFNGNDYTFTVETRKRNGDNPQVILELQTISPDLYYFLKSYQLFRISTDDAYTTPIGLYSNVSDGWGIFGSLSYDRHIIYY